MPMAMMRRLLTGTGQRSLLFVAALLAMPIHAQAMAADDGALAVPTAEKITRAPLPACTARNAARVNIAAILADPSAWTGKCVRLEGVVDNVLISTDADARYRMMGAENTPSSNGASLGLDGRHDFNRPVRARVIGRVWDCEAADSALRGPPPNVHSALGGLDGFCAMRRGLYLSSSSLNARGAVPLPRRLPQHASADFGNLAIISDKNPHLTRLTNEAIAFLDAVKARDASTLLQMHIGTTGTGDATAARRAVDLILNDPKSPFALLRRGYTIHTKMLGWRMPYWAEGRAIGDPNHAEAYACYSINANADRLWPIDTSDIDNRPTRPYACTRILLDQRGAVQWVRFETERGTGLESVEPTTASLAQQGGSSRTPRRR